MAAKNLNYCYYSCWCSRWTGTSAIVFFFQSSRPYPSAFLQSVSALILEHEKGSRKTYCRAPYLSRRRRLLSRRLTRPRGGLRRRGQRHTPPPPPLPPSTAAFPCCAQTLPIPLPPATPPSVPVDPPPPPRKVTYLSVFSCLLAQLHKLFLQALGLGMDGDGG